MSLACAEDRDLSLVSVGHQRAPGSALRLPAGRLSLQIPSLAFIHASPLIYNQQVFGSKG